VARELRGATTTFAPAITGLRTDWNSQTTRPRGFDDRSGAVTPGGTVTLTMLASGTGGKPYQMGISDATTPGILLPADGRVVDLAPSWVLDFRSPPNNGADLRLLGLMSGLGYGIGSVAIPAAPSLIGYTFYAPEE